MRHVSGEDLAVIIVDRGMMDDHLPNNVLAALKHCQKEVRKVCSQGPRKEGEGEGEGTAVSTQPTGAGGGGKGLAQMPEERLKMEEQAVSIEMDSVEVHIAESEAKTNNHEQEVEVSEQGGAKEMNRNLRGWKDVVQTVSADVHEMTVI